MPPFDGKAMAADVLAAVRDYVARALVPIQAKLAELEEFRKEAFGATPIGPEQIDAIIRDAIAAIPKPKDPEPEQVAALLREWFTVPKDGEPGKSVTAEELRPLIAEECMNIAACIPRPKDGEPGRDAAHLEIAAEIDEAKSYPRGTYAKHANGFWRAFEQTQAMRGWECLVAGVAEVEVSCAHEREFTVSHVLSDGTRFCQAFAIPVAIYRGVYVEGRHYAPGDQVSWGAHQWHCNEPTTDKPIEGGKAWTLAVKRGRDGKEGPAGPAGKDRIVREKA